MVNLLRIEGQPDELYVESRSLLDTLRAAGYRLRSNGLWSEGQAILQLADTIGEEIEAAASTSAPYGQLEKEDEDARP